MVRNWVLMIAALAMLAACGADGDPVDPGPGVTLSGDVRMGVTFEP